MATVFILLFFAALVGVFRPYRFIPGGRRWQYGLTAVICFFLVGVFAPKPDSENKPATAAALKSAEQPAAKEPHPQNTTPAEVPSKWAYDETRDEMRNSSRKFAEVESENTVDLDFPYGEQKGFLTVRRDPQYGLDVMFRVRSGQILCHGFGDSYLNVKFDNGPVRRFNCTDASDGSSDVAFVSGAASFLSSLKKADRTVIEAEFYQNGRVQYIFDTRNLKWD